MFRGARNVLRLTLPRNRYIGTLRRVATTHYRNNATFTNSTVKFLGGGFAFVGCCTFLSNTGAAEADADTDVRGILVDVAAKAKGIEEALSGDNASPGGSSGSSVIELAATGPTSPQHERPALVLVHGLDSTRHTWTTFIKATEGQWNVLAVDQRGHGESDLGAEEEFSIDAMVADLRHTVQQHNLLNGGKKVVLVGHSMGGRIAMAYAAAHPEDLHAVVIEDMDIKPRNVPSITGTELAKRRAFSRAFSTWDAAADVLGGFGYDGTRVDGWKVDGRVFKRDDGTWWSGINPMAQMLARKHVLGLGTAAEDAWRTLGKAPFPVLLFVAEKDSACSSESLASMKVLAPNAEVTFFPNATHSIHNSAVAEFSSVIAELYTKIHTTTPGRATHHDEL